MSNESTDSITSGTLCIEASLYNVSKKFNWEKIFVIDETDLNDDRFYAPVLDFKTFDRLTKKVMENY